MEFIELDLSNVTEEQLKATIECNIKTAHLTRLEIEKLKKIAVASTKTTKPSLVLPADKPDDKENASSVDYDFENEVEYYQSQIRDLDKSNIDEEFETAIPSRRHHQYERILTRLKLEAIKTIKEIKELLAEEGLQTTDLSYFQEEYNNELKKIQLINEAQKPQKEKKEEAVAENNLIFIPTQGGDLRVLEEIKSIPYEYYDRFYGLFQSIKDGTFKNVKRFVSNSDLAGLCEVKDFKVRVVFVRLNRNSYAVISSFIKKSDADKAYRTGLSKKYAEYQQIEPKILAQLDNEEFMTMQKQYEEELFNMLSPFAKISIAKKKVGVPKC